MRENVGDHKHRIARSIAYRNLHLGSVLLHDGAVKREREHEPLEFLDSAVDVRIEVCNAAFLVKRFRLEVEPRRVGVAADDAQTGGRPAVSDHCGEQRLAVVSAIDFVAGLQPAGVFQVAESRLFQQFDGCGVRAPFRLRLGEKLLVAFNVFFRFFVHGTYYTTFLHFVRANMLGWKRFTVFRLLSRSAGNCGTIRAFSERHDHEIDIFGFVHCRRCGT